MLLAGDACLEGHTATWVSKTDLVVVTDQGLKRITPGAEPKGIQIPGVTALDSALPPLRSPSGEEDFILCVWRQGPTGARDRAIYLVAPADPSGGKYLTKRSSLRTQPRCVWAAWSADGAAIGYTGDKTGVPPKKVKALRAAGSDQAHAHEDVEVEMPWRAIWLVDAETGSEQQLTKAAGCDDFAPALSPDGKRVVFCRVCPDRLYGQWKRICSAPLPICSLVSLDLKTKETRLLTASISDTRPAFSPSGEWLGFVRQELGFFSIWLYKRRSESVSRLVSGALFGGLHNTPLTWTTDSRHILFACDGDIYAAPISGALPSRLTTGAGITDHWTISPDEHHVAFRRAQTIYITRLNWPEQGRADTE